MLLKNSILNINNIKPILFFISFASIIFIVYHYVKTIKHEPELFNYLIKIYKIRLTNPGFWLILCIIFIMNGLVINIKYKNNDEFNDYKNIRSATTLGSILLISQLISGFGSWTIQFFIAFLMHYFMNNLIDTKFNNHKASL